MKYEEIFREIVENHELPIPEILENLKAKTSRRINSAEDRCVDKCPRNYYCSGCRLQINLERNIDLLDEIDKFKKEFDL